MPLTDEKLAKSSNYLHLHLNLSDVDDWQTLRSNMLQNDTKTPMAQFTRIPRLLRLGIERNNQIMRNDLVQEFMHIEQKFDLFLLGFAINDALIGFAAHFHCPTVIISTTFLLKPLRDLVASPTAVTSSLIFNKDIELENAPTFTQRLQMLFAYSIEYVVVNFMDYFYNIPQYTALFPPDKYPSLMEVRKNVSLVLVNQHFSQGNIRPMTPNVVEISGIQIPNEVKPLPIVRIHQIVHHTYLC